MFEASRTVLLVTHDNDLIDEVATPIWHFEDHKIEDFKGSYKEYQEQCRCRLAGVSDL